MSDSAPPPARASARGHLQSVARVSRIVAAVLLAAVAIRFALASADFALGESRSNFTSRPLPHAAGPPAAPEPGSSGVPAGEISAARAASARAGEAPSAGPGGRPLRVTLGVNFGPPRSEVYVNGSRVGQAPFLGDTSCKWGQPIRIEVVPNEGAPLTYLRECRGGSIELNGPPP